MSEPQDDPKDAVGKVDDMLDIDYVDRPLPVPMTDGERLALGEEIAREQESAEVAEEKKKALDEEMKGQIDTAYQKVSELTKRLRHGKVNRPVQCQVRRDYRIGYIRVMRMDDGTEVSSRPMTSEERQLGMRFTSEE